MQLYFSEYDTPLATLLIVTDRAGVLRGLDFDDNDARLKRLLRLHYGTDACQAQPTPQPLQQALEAYFSGELTALDALPVETGGTTFQREVWQALREIPPGTTQSYGRLAEQLGRPSASRAVGAANGANPISIVVPCHRVIGASGALTGYAGSLPRKRWLLEHERLHAAALLSLR